jgi:hypothetical protein
MERVESAMSIAEIERFAADLQSNAAMTGGWVKSNGKTSSSFLIR